MKQALVGEQLVSAAPGAPARAICPGCGGLVELRERLGTCFWRHVALPRGGCELQRAGDLGSVQAAEGGGDVVVAGAPERQVRQVGAFVIELHPEEGGRLVLRSPGVEEGGEPSGMIVPLAEVRALAEGLLDAAADLVGLVVEVPRQARDDS